MSVVYPSQHISIVCVLVKACFIVVIVSCWTVLSYQTLSSRAACWCTDVLYSSCLLQYCIKNASSLLLQHSSFG